MIVGVIEELVRAVLRICDVSDIVPEARVQAAVSELMRRTKQDILSWEMAKEAHLAELEDE